MPNACASCGLASVSILASTTEPSRAAAACSSSGLRARHGPHQAAQKSTTTGVVEERSRTSAWKSDSLTSMTVMHEAYEIARHRPMERIIERDRITLAAVEGGEGPVVVGLHGLTATRRYVLMGSRAVERAGRRVAVSPCRPTTT